MRVPDDIRRTEIKRVLVRAGITAGDELWVELDRLALEYAERAQSKAPTCRQLQHSIDDALAEIARFRGVFGGRDVVTYFTGNALAAETRNLLDRLERKLQSANVAYEGRDAPEIVQTESGLRLVAGDGVSRNAHKVARESYWEGLTHFWQSIAPANTPRQRLIDFVAACSGASEPAVRSYFDRKRASK